MHSYAYPEHEILVGNLAKEIGFEQSFVIVCVDTDGEGVPRGYTVAVDAYLTPKLKECT